MPSNPPDVSLSLFVNGLSFPLSSCLDVIAAFLVALKPFPRAIPSPNSCRFTR